MLFAIELYVFSIGTIRISIHIEHVPKSICISNILQIELVPKQPVKLVGILVIKLAIPPNIVKTTITGNFLPPRGWRNDC